jgi:hypothetical protein
MNLDLTKENLLKEIGIEQNESTINFQQWMELSKEKELSEEFIRTFHKQVNWVNITIYQKLSEYLITHFIHKIVWRHFL